MTRLPETAPRPYARSQLGPNVMAWMRRKGWIDQRKVTRLADDPAAVIVARIVA
jgi:hypothetical protein